MESATTPSVVTLSNRKPSHSVITQVATQEGVDPLELPPLYSAIDPEALDALFASSTTDESAVPGQVRFTYLDYEVRVTGDGEVTLSEL